MKHKTAIVTDSTSDIPLNLAAERGITITPLHIIWGRENLRDGVDITSKQFYERLVQEKDLPSTSQPTPGEFADIFQRARDEQDAEQVIAITLSAELSGTHESAVRAVKMVDFPVHVVDGRTTSGALGLQAIALADARDRGASNEDLVSLANDYATRTQAMLTIDTLEFLQRSGRVSATRRWIGSALQIKPILYVKDGQMLALEAVRSRKRALKRLMELFLAEIDRSKPLYVAILHANTPDIADAYEAQIRAYHEPVFLMKVVASSAVGVHTGPRAMGLTLFQ